MISIELNERVRLDVTRVFRQGVELGLGDIWGFTYQGKNYSAPPGSVYRVSPIGDGVLHIQMSYEDIADAVITQDLPVIFLNMESRSSEDRPRAGVEIPEVSRRQYETDALNVTRRMDLTNPFTGQRQSQAEYMQAHGDAIVAKVQRDLEAKAEAKSLAEAIANATFDPFEVRVV